MTGKWESLRSIFLSPIFLSEKAAVPFSLQSLVLLGELPNLTREERREIVQRIHELDGDDWLEEGQLTEEEKALELFTVSRMRRSGCWLSSMPRAMIAIGKSGSPESRDPKFPSIH